MQDRLLRKYNVPVPRYTSYPPANYFKDGFTGEAYEEAIKQSNTATPEHLSFYIHIPYCKRMCHYCGCNSCIIGKPEEVQSYLTAIHKEVDMMIERLDSSRKIAQIHYGGGTPTILPVDELKKLNDRLLSAFGTIEQPEIAIECHPGYMNADYWIELTEAGFNRFSIGVQDFDLKVLRAINRKPSLLPLEAIFAILRGKEAQINVDLMYGLPMQNVKSFGWTIEKVIGLQPDRVVTFSYAHLPDLFPRQRFLESAGFPSEQEKSRMYALAWDKLWDAGYQPIGLDHFVREGDELYQALQEGTLHRNFQGYCSRRTTGQVYAFGVTGISQLDIAYAQNTKDINMYIQRMEHNEWAVSKGYTLNRDEQITRMAIDILMCNYRLDWKVIAEKFGVSVEEAQAATGYDERQIHAFAADGIVYYEPDYLEMTPDGALYVRNVAASLDKLMRSNTRTFSRPV